MGKLKEKQKDMGPIVNWDYIKQLRDFYLFLKLSLIGKNNSKIKTGAILIVNPCLVGDFVVSLPAIRQFIRDNKGFKIDIIVSPPLKRLASRIIGIRNVFVAQSSVKREIEKSEDGSSIYEGYDKIIIMRISDDSYRLIKRVNSNQLSSSYFKFIKYQIIQPIKDSILKRRPLQRRHIDFDILGLKSKDLVFEDIFNFNKKDYDSIKKLDALKTRNKIIIIHTGPVWIMRRWENKKWAELIKKINSLGKFRFIFVGTGDAESDYGEISNLLNFRVYSLINKVDIHDLMLVLRSSDYFIGVDSGPRNMAHLADLRSITLFGPAASGAIYLPWSKKDIVIDRSEGGGAYEALFYRKNSFIKKVTVDEVILAFKKLLKSSKDK